jgi:hypothetical protein
MTGTDELRQLRAENALLTQAQTTLQAQVATSQVALAAAQEQIAQLQREVVRLAAERTPQVDFGGQVLGQGRLGVRLLHEYMVEVWGHAGLPFCRSML